MSRTASNDPLEQIRDTMRGAYLADETAIVRSLMAEADLSPELRDKISREAADLVRAVRDGSDPTVMESFLAEYGLSTKEGVALMCLAEALLRVPDADTIDELIEDKITPGSWGAHLGHSSSSLVNASTWALMLTGKVLAPAEETGLVMTLQSVVKRLGEPVVRTAVAQAMRELGRQFVLGRTIEEALQEGADQQARGYTYSFDMLGEAARTDRDARRYHLAYSDAISELAPHCNSDDIRENPGISVKLSALHARYEFGQRDRVMTELVARARSLAVLAKSANMGFNIDAEEADRLDISLDVIEAILSDPALANWDGFGVVVQAFGLRASYVLDWLYGLAERLDRKIMVRLVKGAYWDTEIKRAQVLGLPGFPVFTRKINTDVSYMACAAKLLRMTDRIYPQFATHNAHSVATVLHLAQGRTDFEFQRLHGMGEALHDTVLREHKTRCRIYAPVGAHRDLLAYLVRRLLENGANSSFVNQIVDDTISPEDIAGDPFAEAEALGGDVTHGAIRTPADLYGAGRRNAKGWDITDPVAMSALETARAGYRSHQWSGGPLIAGKVDGAERIEVRNPALPGDRVGDVLQASGKDVDVALAAAEKGFASWSGVAAAERAAIVGRIGDLYEVNAPELFALAAREAGKTLLDGVGEVREAIDFTRYYAGEAVRTQAAGTARGIIVCISPWNFPLAIFTGQISAALAAGNAVIAKPAEQTALMAVRAVELMHEAGVPTNALQLLPGDGATGGGALTSDPRIAGVCFTGSTQTAQRINRVMAEHVSPDAPLIAETGGLNAMIVDSSALPEQAVRDILASAFQSAGQRCSALRMLYIQEDVEDRVLEMLTGAMDELRLGDPWELATDVGPVIDLEAKTRIDVHCGKLKKQGRLIKVLDVPKDGLFVAPSLFRLDGIEDLEEEIFGPILHIATFDADEIDQVVDAVNAKGFGLTFGLHTRVDSRVQRIIDRLEVGNIYVNRNQIGAIVGSQPFGGEGLSGTGPKAGGPHYVRRFLSAASKVAAAAAMVPDIDAAAVQAAIDDMREKLRNGGGGSGEGEALDLPGPTGESNRLSHEPRGIVLCLGPGEDAARAQLSHAIETGNAAIVVTPGASAIVAERAKGSTAVISLNGTLDPRTLAAVHGFNAVASDAAAETQRAIRQALAERDGEILQPIVDGDGLERFVIERHVCIDTTAAGGNASLLAQASS